MPLAARMAGPTRAPRHPCPWRGPALDVLRLRGLCAPSAADKLDDDDDDSTVITEDEAIERIKDRVRDFSWENMELLVAGMLRAMGYKTHMTQKGADGGRDIIASPDGFGLEQPRIVAEVKHRQKQMDAEKVRAFVGTLRNSDSGLYVSTGGFTKDARLEAQRATRPVHLLDLDQKDVASAHKGGGHVSSYAYALIGAHTAETLEERLELLDHAGLHVGVGISRGEAAGLLGHELGDLGAGLGDLALGE